MSGYTTINFHCPSNHPSNNNFKYRYYKLSDGLEHKITENRNSIFKPKGISGQTTQQIVESIEKKLRKNPQKLPYMSIIRNNTQNKQKQTNKRKSLQYKQYNSIKGYLKYQLSPLIDLNKSVYLFKKHVLDQDCSNYLNAKDRRQKSYEFKKLNNNQTIQKINDSDLVTGFRTTLFNKQQTIIAKSNFKSLKHKQTIKLDLIGQKLPNTNERQRQKIQKVQLRRKDYFSPWHIKQQFQS